MAFNYFFLLLIFSVWHFSLNIPFIYISRSGAFWKKKINFFTECFIWCFLSVDDFVYNSSHSIISINNISFVLIISNLLATELCLHSSVVALVTSAWIFFCECCLLLDNIVLFTIICLLYNSLFRVFFQLHIFFYFRGFFPENKTKQNLPQVVAKEQDFTSK